MMQNRVHTAIARHTIPSAAKRTIPIPVMIVSSMPGIYQIPRRL